MRSLVALLIALPLSSVQVHPLVAQDDAGTTEDDGADMEFDLSETKQRGNNNQSSRSARKARPAKQGPFRLEAYGRFTFAGSVGFDYDGVGPGVSPSVDLNPALGIGGGFEYVLHDFFSIGARGQLHYIDVSDSDAGAVLFDMLAVPRGRYTFDGLGLTAYASIPIGLSIVGYDYGDDSTNAAFTLGFLGGADFLVTDSIAIFGEFGFQWHTHGVGNNGLGDVTANITYVFMHFGAKLAL